MGELEETVALVGAQLTKCSVEGLLEGRGTLAGRLAALWHVVSPTYTVNSRMSIRSYFGLFSSKPKVYIEYAGLI